MLPVTVIGGYLGAGKTTLVNHLLRHADGIKIAVLVNEFGTLAIDADLIEAQDETLISIAGGCVCCSYGNDLIQAMLDLQQLDPKPDHVVIEASGVALPGAIGSSISLLEDYHLDGIVVMCDAETIQEQAANDYIGDTIERQLTDANLVLLNKGDLVSADQHSDLRTWVQGMAPQAAVIPAEQGQVPNAVVLQPFAPSDTDLSERGPHQMQSFASRVIHFDRNLDADEVAQTLADPALALIRAKGFVPTSSGLRAIQVVGRRWSVTQAPLSAKPGVVVIAQKEGADLDAVALRCAQIG